MSIFNNIIYFLIKINYIFSSELKSEVLVRYLRSLTVQNQFEKLRPIRHMRHLLKRQRQQKA